MEARCPFQGALQRSRYQRLTRTVLGTRVVCGQSQGHFGEVAIG